MSVSPGNSGESVRSSATTHPAPHRSTWIGAWGLRSEPTLYVLCFVNDFTDFIYWGLFYRLYLLVLIRFMGAPCPPEVHLVLQFTRVTDKGEFGVYEQGFVS